MIGNNNLSSDEEELEEEEDPCEEEEEEDWMFQTFTGLKKGQNKNKAQVNDKRQGVVGNKNPMDIDSGLGSSYEEASNSSPFDMPSEIMSK